MKCNCAEKSLFHCSLYGFGIQENISDIKSKNSKKKVSFCCTSCTNIRRRYDSKRVR